MGTDKETKRNISMDLTRTIKLDIEDDLSKEKLKSIIRSIADFYIKSFKLQEDEVAIFLTNKHKTTLSFAFPEYLVGSGVIPIDSPEAIVAHIYRTGNSFINNKLLEQEHLSVFEFIKTPHDETKLIWKMMGALISFEGEKIGVIEISRKREAFSKLGDDFTKDNLKFLESTIHNFSPIVKDLQERIFKVKREELRRDLTLLAEIIRWRRNLSDGDCVKITTRYLGMTTICRGFVTHKYSLDKIEIKTSSGNCKPIMFVAVDSLWPCSWDRSKMRRALLVFQKMKKLHRIFGNDFE